MLCYKVIKKLARHQRFRARAPAMEAPASALQRFLSSALFLLPEVHKIGYNPEVMEDHIIYISAGVFLLLFFVIGFLARRSRHKKAAAEKAAIVFREKVMSELQGLYPVPRHLDAKEYSRFRESIPGIEHAAAEFRHSLPSGKRDAFDDALNNYTAHCRDIRWVDSATFRIIPGEKRPEDEGPREIFRQNVNALLSFAKKKD